MVESIVVYVTLFVLMVLTGTSSNKNKLSPEKRIPGIYMLIPCLIFAFVFGCRYNVGVDYMDYLEGYRGTYLRSHEIGFNVIESFLRGINAHFAVFFGVLAFLQITFFLSAFKEREVFPYLIFVLIIGTGCLTWMNGIRQAVSSCIFVYSIQFISNKKPIKYLLCCFLAFLFHKSSAILVPFYFIQYLDLSKHRWVPWALFLLAIIVKYSNVGMYVEMAISPIAGYLEYDSIYDLDYIMEAMETNAGSTGLGVLLQDFIFIFVIILIPKLRCEYNSIWIKVVITLFLIGMFGVVAFPGQVLLRRPFAYFTIFTNVLIAYSLLYLFRKGGNNDFNKVMGWVLIATQVLMFVAVVLLRGNDNLCAFHFFWDI